jgi:hypothetical protein
VGLLNVIPPKSVKGDEQKTGIKVPDLLWLLGRNRNAKEKKAKGTKHAGAHGL